MFGSVGSWQIADTARLLKKSFTSVQVAGEEVIFVVFHNPPSTPAHQTVLCVASAESIIIALMRPEVTSLFGRLLPLDGPTASELEPLSIQLNAVVEPIRFE